MSASEDIRNDSVRNSVFLQRYTRRTIRRALEAINAAAERIYIQIVRRDPGSSRFSQRRLGFLLNAVEQINADAMTVFEEILLADSRELAGIEAEGLLFSINRALPVELETKLPSSDQLWGAVNARPFQGRFLQDYFRDLPETTFARIRNEITMGFIEGRTTDQIVRDIRGTARSRFKDGILEINRRSATSVVRTALNHTATAAREETFRRNSDIVKGVQWVSTLDGRTSAICRSRDGEVYPVDEGPRPPAHPNCRSTVTPVLKSWRELGIRLGDVPVGTRASLNGQVPATETYETWIRQQPVEFQDEVLGRTKGRLFRQGGLSLDRFVDRSGDEYTIDELRARYSEAFERANID